MHDKLREFERDSGLEIFGLGARQEIWEAALKKYAELIVRECAGVTLDYKNDDYYTGWCDHAGEILRHFGIEEHKGWICPKCGTDRTKTVCPLGFGASIDGRCPMTVEAQ